MYPENQFANAAYSNVGRFAREKQMQSVKSSHGRLGSCISIANDGHVGFNHAKHGGLTLYTNFFNFFRIDIDSLDEIVHATDRDDEGPRNLVSQAPVVRSTDLMAMMKF